MEHGSKEIIRAGNGIINKTFSYPMPSMNNGDLFWNSVTVKYNEQTFFLTFSRVGEIYYTFVYMYGNKDEAKRYRTTISVGQGTDTGILHTGQIFPIDIKKTDIFKQKSGVVSFMGTGMTEAFFFNKIFPGQEHEHKVVRIRYELSRAAQGPSHNESTPKVEYINGVLCTVSPADHQQFNGW